MKVTNQSRKILAINGEPLLPKESMELPEGFSNHPMIIDYFKKGILVHSEQIVDSPVNEIGDLERTKIAEEAIAKYKKEQEALAVSKAEKEAEKKAVKNMKKMELFTKAVGMGLEVKEEDSADVLKEKIIAALEK